MPAARPGEQRIWDETFDYWFFADRFHWTPDQVDEMPLRIFERMRDVTLLVERVRSENARRAQGAQVG